MRTLVQHGDWSSGATGVGTTALLLGILTLLASLAWYFLRRRLISTLLIAAVVTGILLAAGSGLIAVAGSLHSTQARYSEDHGLWPDAIVEYAYTGEVAPNAPNLARVYNEWGEQQLRDHSYSAAVAHFNIVVTNYRESSAAV